MPAVGVRDTHDIVLSPESCQACTHVHAPCEDAGVGVGRILCSYFPDGSVSLVQLGRCRPFCACGPEVLETCLRFSLQVAICVSYWKRLAASQNAVFALGERPNVIIEMAVLSL